MATHHILRRAILVLSLASPPPNLIMLHVLLSVTVLSALVSAYSDQELQRGEACIKLLVVYHSLGDSRVYEIVKARDDLDPTQVEDRIMMDMFAYCTEHADMRDLTDMVKANTREEVNRFRHYLQFSPAKYQAKEVDLTVKPEESAFRNESLRPRARMHIADMEGTREALEFAERVRRQREEAKNSL